jgi:hypothetical protein
MSLPRKLLIGALALAGFLFSHPAKAQQDVIFFVTATPSPVSVNSPLLYTIVVSNVTGLVLPVQLINLSITNSFSGPFNVIVASNSPNHLGDNFLDGNGNYVFRINQLPATGIGNVATLRLTVSPQNGGSFTNRISANTPGRPFIDTTNVLTQVHGPSTDLAVGMTNVASGIFVGDSTVIGLSVTNFGPVATGVVLSNIMPASFQLLSLSPTNSHTFTNGNLTLNNGATRRFQVTVQPTNAVTNFNLVASVSAGNIQDTNTANNTVTNVISVSDFLSTNLVVTELSQQFNPQTGLREMLVQLSNIGTNDVPAARVIVSGITNNAWLYNAFGTNSGDAYVLHNTTLASGAAVNLLLEFYVFKRSELIGCTLSGLGVPAINLNVAGTNGVLATITDLSGGSKMIEFPATPGKTYTIVYASDLSFSDGRTAQPAIVAPANRVQWIDNGPPKTVSHPNATTNRVYRVFQSQ